jgi:tetratricopeptide (TPR) repeat protein
MLESITGQDVPWGLAQAVHRQTEGNPLFVQEVVRYLAEEGLISREEGRWRPTGQAPLEMSIPEGLRDVIGRRLSSLSPECNRLLSIASVIGREFRLEVLQKVTGISEDELFAALEEAKKAAVVEERSAVAGAVTYRFAHAFFRQTLYEEIIAPRRIRLHQQVAQALEQVYAARLEEHAAEMAEHFSYSPDLADLGRAVSYGEMAAQRARAVYAFSDAARLLEQALKVQEVLDPEDKEKKYDLLVALGDALLFAGEPRRILDVEATKALSVAEAMGDSMRASGICRLAIRALITYGFTEFATPEGAHWAERADHHAEPDTEARAWADMALGLVKGNRGERGEALLRQALDLARRFGDPETLCWTGAMWVVFATAPQYFEERLRLVEELEVARHSVLSIEAVFGLLYTMFLTLLEAGQRGPAEEALREYRSVAERTGWANALIVSMQFDTILTILDGRLEEAVEMTDRMLTRAEELGISEYGWILEAVMRPRLLLHLGRNLDGLQNELHVALHGPRRQWAIPPLGLVLAHLGREVEAEEMLQQQVLARPGIGSAEDETAAWVDTLFLEASVLVKHREAAQLLLCRLAGSSVRTSGVGLPTCVARHLGAAAALLGRPEEARDHFQAALEVATQMSFRPEIALTQLQLAELLLEHYPDERAEALEHLDVAIGEFRDMKMQPSLERALRRKDILKA